MFNIRNGKYNVNTLYDSKENQTNMFQEKPKCVNLLFISLDDGHYKWDVIGWTVEL